VSSKRRSKKWSVHISFTLNLFAY